MMADILKGLPDVQDYLDDFIVNDSTPAEHDQNYGSPFPNPVMKKILT